MEPIDIFIGYAQQDKPLMDRLRKQLSAAERIGLIDSWHDGEIEVGSDREEAARIAMENAEMIILLLSADFFASEYLYEKEMAQALALSAENRAKVIPVILRECTWQLTPLSKLQVLPKNEIAVTDDHWKHPDNAFKHVVDEVIKFSNQIRKQNGNPTTPYIPSEQKEKGDVEKNISKTVSIETAKEEKGTPLWKLALYAFFGLAGMALFSFLINQFFMAPTPNPPIGQEEQLPPKEEPTQKTSLDPKQQPTQLDPSFKTIYLNNLEWSAQNINISSPDSWCYDNDPKNCEKYGRLYNYTAALDICPEGWRLPNQTEWLALSTEEIKELQLNKGGLYDKGYYRQLSKVGYYFTPDPIGGDLAIVVEFRGIESPLQKDSRYMSWGMSCRCVK